MSTHERDTVLRAFGRTVRARRLALGLTQEQLAQRAGVGRSYITDVELGMRNVALTTMLRLAAALEIPASLLLTEVDEAVPRPAQP